MKIGTLSTWTRIQASAWLPALVWFAWGAPVEHARGAAALGVGLSMLSLALVVGAPRTLADLVTLGRGAVVAVVLAAPFGLADRPWTCWSLLIAAAGLDLVDGAVARGRGATAHGASLDMEIDQLSVLAMATLVCLDGGLSLVLALPALRYAYVLASWPAGLPATDPKPQNGDNRVAKRICAAVVAALLLARTPGVPAWLRDGAVVVAVALLTWSFSSDWRFLMRGRRAEAST